MIIRKSFGSPWPKKFFTLKANFSLKEDFRKENGVDIVSGLSSVTAAKFLTRWRWNRLICKIQKNMLNKLHWKLGECREQKKIGAGTALSFTTCWFQNKGKKINTYIDDCFFAAVKNSFISFCCFFHVYKMKCTSS